MSESPQSQYVDVDGFAKILCVGRRTVYKLIRLRQIPYRTLLGRRRSYILIDPQEALAVLERNRLARPKN